MQCRMTLRTNLLPNGDAAKRTQRLPGRTPNGAVPPQYWALRSLNQPRSPPHAATSLTLNITLVLRWLEWGKPTTPLLPATQAPADRP
jgi:hypothetical protein